MLGWDLSPLASDIRKMYTSAAELDRARLKNKEGGKKKKMLLGCGALALS